MVRLPNLHFSDLELVEHAAPPFISGVYFYYDENEKVIYVGKSKCLRERFLQHRQAHDVPGAKYYKYAVVFDPVDMDIYETYYINRIKPPLNKSKAFYKQEVDHIEIVARAIAEMQGISVRMAKKRYFGGK